MQTDPNLILQLALLGVVAALGLSCLFQFCHGDEIRRARRDRKLARRRASRRTRRS
jgi:hypothetical protein